MRTEGFRKRLARWARDLAVMGAIVGTIGWWQARGMLDGATPGPAFDRPLLAGGTLQSSALTGKRTLLYFFAPWCGVCKVSIGNLATLAAWSDRDRTNVVAVATDYETVDSVREFVKDRAPDVPVLLGDDALRDAYKISAYPSVYVLDAEGRVRWASVGYTTLLGLLWRVWTTS